MVLADEPTSALDHSNRDLVLRVLQGLADAGALVLIATHSDHVADQCSHHICLAGDAPGADREPAPKRADPSSQV